MRNVRKVLHILFVFIMVSLLGFVVSMELWPEKTSQIVGFRFYTVLTDSMEPTIPTYSLVMTRVLPKDAKIEPNTIITFEGDRFGDDILLTHYFRKTQEKDGVTYYRTQPEGKDINDETEYDFYETTRDDIIGTYLFHIPFVGKMILFLKSPFGFVMYGELFVIFLINRLILAKWEEKNNKTEEQIEIPLKKKQRYEVVIEQVAILKSDDYVIVSGDIINHSKKPIQYVKANIVGYDRDDVVLLRELMFLSDRKHIGVDEVRHFERCVTYCENIDHVGIELVKYRSKT